jgi:hypothetical protein
MTDLEKLNQAILETNFGNSNYSENLNYLLGRYKKQLEEEERRQDAILNAQYAAGDAERDKAKQERYKQKLKRIEQRYGIFARIIFRLSPLIIFGSILLLLLSINDWRIAKFFLNILIFLFKLLSAILALWASMIGIG